MKQFVHWEATGVIIIIIKINSFYFPPREKGDKTPVKAITLPLMQTKVVDFAKQPFRVVSIVCRPIYLYVIVTTIYFCNSIIWAASLRSNFMSPPSIWLLENFANAQTVLIQPSTSSACRNTKNYKENCLVFMFLDVNRDNIILIDIINNKGSL